MSEWYRPAGSASRSGFDVAIGPREAGWEHTGLYVTTLAPGESRRVFGGQHEWLVLPLSGQAQVECAGKLLFLSGRAGPFAGPTDFAYVPVSSIFTVTSTAGARIALPHAKASKPLPFRRVRAEETVVELRGAGQCSRQVNNFGTPSVLEADSIIACEVLTPAGNWSSYPPHKHDEHRQDRESDLEEIYYYEMRADADAPDSAKPFGYQRIYGTKHRPINILAEVRNGDVVLVPHGWHGPTMAPPGYDMYSLNVMAGPGTEREWLVSDDPDHAWVRQTWASQKIDPRLPFGQHVARGDGRR
jgi:5-deoxy-glucuronate isomerase